MLRSTVILRLADQEIKEKKVIRSGVILFQAKYIQDKMTFAHARILLPSIQPIFRYFNFDTTKGS